MTNNNCLNCGKELTDKYCPGCGQKADTHRISFQNFLFHDVLHGTFHLEKGMLFTAKQALTRPGKAALDYISGKRVRYYNVFYLILITAGFILFIRHFNDVLYLNGGGKLDPPHYINEASKRMDEIISQKSKIIIFLFVPFGALTSFILFRRKKLNLTEHAIIAGMILLGMLLISALGHLFFYLDLIIPFSNTFATVMRRFVIALIILYIGYGYFNAFSNGYSRLGMACRTGLFFALMCLETAVLFLILMGFVTNWKFGTVTVSPF